MKRIRFLISELAASDILEQADWYRAQSGAPLAKRWEKAITSSHSSNRAESEGRHTVLLLILGSSNRKAYHYQRVPKASDLLSLHRRRTIHTSGGAWRTRPRTAAMRRM